MLRAHKVSRKNGSVGCRNASGAELSHADEWRGKDGGVVGPWVSRDE
jgi:hypothetical protein